MAVNFDKLTHHDIQTLCPYIPGKSAEEIKREQGLSHIIKLASNENPLGCSALVQKALSSITGHKIATYPMSAEYDLLEKLADKLNINSNMITLANGSNSLFPLLMQCFALHQNKHILTHDYAFMSYPIVAKSLGIPLTSIALQENWHVDIDAMIKATNAQTALIFIANPNNPTGLLIKQQHIKTLLQNIPTTTVIVIDEAYFEYVEKKDQSNINMLLAKHPNLVVTRTFSKAYGLAGLRIGYAIANESITAILKKVMQPFSVNLAAIIAGTAALDDNEFIQQSVSSNYTERSKVQQGLIKLGYDPLPSDGNFLTFDCQNNPNKIFQYMLNQGIIIRPLKPLGLANYLRVSIGTESQNQRFLSKLEEFNNLE